MVRVVNSSLWRGLVLAALTVAAYGPAMRGGFVWDDALYLRDNPIVRAPDGLRRIWCTTEFPEYFALSNTSFWFEYRLWGDNPVGYRVTNITLHIANALLLWLLLSRLGLPGSFWAALLFAVHPVAVESVAWISERKNVLSMLFALLTTLAFFRWDETRDRRSYAAMLAGFVLALLSKPAVVMLPVVLLLIVWWRRGRVEDRYVVATAPLFAMSLAMGLVAIWYEQTHSIAGELVREDSLPARLAGIGWAVWFYAGKALWPAHLSVIYSRWHVEAGQPLAWMGIAALLALMMVLWRRRGAFAAMACFVALLFPVLGVFDVSFFAYSYVADHWGYMSLTCMMALVAAGMRWRPVLAGLGVALAVLTWQRAHVWRDEETLWRDTLAKNPRAWMAHNNLANELHRQGLDDEAIGHYRATIQMKPGYGNAHYNLGIVFYRRGEFAEAVAEFGQAVRLKPHSAEARNNLGAALVATGRTNDAIAQFKSAAALAPNWDEPRSNLSRVGQGVP